MIGLDHAPDIIEAIRDSAVARMLVVDDAYDAPVFSDEWAGEMLDMLQHEDFRDNINDEALSIEVCDAAVEALNDGEYDHNAIEIVLGILYSAYLEKRDSKFDLGGRFEAIKGGALDALEPLILLLNTCGDDIRVELAGKNDAQYKYVTLKPDIIFMDFYLSPQTSSPRLESSSTLQYDRRQSIKLLRELLSHENNNAPAVVLMSSQDIGTKANNYRTNLDGRVMALRFGYLHKNWITQEANAAQANGEAADVLIDTSASLEFGRSLEAALADWQKGAEAAINTLQGDLRNFEIRDFAYLMRFRLYEEGERFADYLEWFLGESLRALVDQKVQWSSTHFQDLDKPDLTRGIIGADPIPSQQIGQFFHRMRFSDPEARKRNRFALGDVFVSAEKKNVRMIISPDCDLVPRERGVATERLLSVGGKIKSFEEDGAFANELVWLNGPKGIKWLNKDLMTHPVSSIDHLIVDKEEWKFFSRLSALPAQAVQKAALADLSRVGVSVPPTVHVGASVKCFIRLQEGSQVQTTEIAALPSSKVQVFMPRGGSDNKKRLLFTPEFVRALRADLIERDSSDIAENSRDVFAQLMSRLHDLDGMMLRHGFPIPHHDESLGVASALRKPGKKGWLHFVCDLSDKELLDVPRTDPFDE